MAINLDFLSDQTKPQGHVYADLHLPFALKTKLSNKYLKDTGQKKDVQLDYDSYAIKNSVQNIFNTMPGQKILNPSFGLDLRQYLFEPITEETAREIGNTIIEQLTEYEPRIVLNNVDIEARENDNEYRVIISITIPDLNNLRTNLDGTLDENGFRYN